MSTLAFERDRTARVRHLRVIGSEPPRPTRLVEREVELELLAGSVARLARGCGGVVMLEAPAGYGKSALLDFLAENVSESGGVVRRATPAPFERGFEFGVIRTLLEALLTDISEPERVELLEGPAAIAGELLVDGEIRRATTTMRLAHSVLCLCARLTSRAPLTLILDDAQWADHGSLEVLAFLARRVRELSLLLAVAARPENADRHLLGLLAGVTHATVLHPQPLSAAGAVRMIHRDAPDIPVRICAQARRSTGGSPWLLSELARQLAAHGESALEQLDALPVTAVMRNSIRRRLSELEPAERHVAQALAILGEEPADRVVADVAGVSFGELAAAHHALAAAALTQPDGPVMHPLVAAAIDDDMPAAEAERLHREAAAALLRVGAESCAVAEHLLLCAPHSADWVSEALVRAARDAQTPRTAARYLERALQEHAPGDDRAALLCRLATVLFDAGLPDPVGHLRAALRETRDSRTRAAVLSRLAAFTLFTGKGASLLSELETELGAETDPSLRAAVQASTLDTLLVSAAEARHRAERVDAVASAAAGDPLLRNVALAHRAYLLSELATEDAETCSALAREALSDGTLLREARHRTAYHLSVRTLIKSDDFAHADDAITALEAHARERASITLSAGAAWYRAELLMRTGELTRAAEQARRALELGPGETTVFSIGAAEVLVCALAEAGELDEARSVLKRFEAAPGARWRGAFDHARARLALCEGDYERALVEARRAGRIAAGQDRQNPSWNPWRSLAARALAHVGRRREAAELADAEVALAERFGAPTVLARARHARALAEPDEMARIALCRAALAELGEGHGRLEAIMLRIELGCALSYVGRRIEAREALRPALADADAVGAVPLARRARRELVATGLRPRRAALDGPASLTPRQRQICELAASGKPNRAIAAELFLSNKTVETHLAAAFRKLGVASRADLAARLAG
jgi:DNA-binding CsgD family transcriptional regulator